MAARDSPIPARRTGETTEEKLVTISRKLELVEKTMAAFRLENQKLRADESIEKITHKLVTVEQILMSFKLENQKLRAELTTLAKRQSTMDAKIANFGKENTTLSLPNGVDNIHIPEIAHSPEAQQWDVSCCKCNQIIIGFRYACLQCKSKDLCEVCEMQHRWSHCLLRLPSIRNDPNNLIGQVTSLNFKDHSNYLTEYVCPKCHLVGYYNSYICLVCENYYHCLSCERSHRHSEHVLIRMRLYNASRNGKHHSKVVEAEKIVREYYLKSDTDEENGIELTFNTTETRLVPSETKFNLTETNLNPTETKPNFIKTKPTPEKIVAKDNKLAKAPIPTKDKPAKKENGKLFSAIKGKTKTKEIAKITPKSGTGTQATPDVIEIAQTEEVVDDEADC